MLYNDLINLLWSLIMITELEFYKSTLLNDVLKFWEENAPDEEFGGFFTCFNNDSSQLLSTDKYIWSQGRMLWCLSKLCTLPYISNNRKNILSKYADKTAEFLQKHSRMQNGNCVFLTDRQGNHKLSNGVYDASIYADCFVIIGLAEYASYRKDYSALEFAYDLYLHSKSRYESGNFNTEPYPEPKQFRTHGLPMIFTNTSRTLADAMASLNHKDAGLVSNYAYSFAKDVIDNFVDENNVLHEMIYRNGGFDKNEMLGRYVNPGHTIEDCWFLNTEWELFNDSERKNKTVQVLKNALRLGWDEEYLGIRLFADCDGGSPKGIISDNNEPMVKKITNDTYSKLWWVHSEALYSTLLFNKYDGITDWYNKIKDYTFSVFPNHENDKGEWIQIRDRYGKPENKIVALPVKDPFHIIRNLILIIEELEKRLNNA